MYIQVLFPFECTYEPEPNSLTSCSVASYFPFSKLAFYLPTWCCTRLSQKSPNCGTIWATTQLMYNALLNDPMSKIHFQVYLKLHIVAYHLKLNICKTLDSLTSHSHTFGLNLISSSVSYLPWRTTCAYEKYILINLIQRVGKLSIKLWRFK